MSYHSTGSTELDRAVAERRRIHAAWGMDDVGYHFVGVTQMVPARSNLILVHFKTRTITRGDVKVEFGRLAFRLVTALLASKWPLANKAIAWHVYGDDISGGPDNARKSVNNLIDSVRHGDRRRNHTFKAKLPLLGLRIVADRNRGYTIARD